MKVGKDVHIAEQAIIKRPELVVIGNHVAIDPFVYVTSQLYLGDYIHIACYVSIIGGKDGVLVCKGFNNLMAGSRFITVSDRFDGSGLFGALIPDKYRGRIISIPIIMEQFSNVGTNAIVLPGTRLREGVLLAAGSLLMGDTVPWMVYKGNPAKPAHRVDRYLAIRNAKDMGYEY